MSTTRTATRFIVAVSLLLVLILSIIPVGAAAAGGEAPRVTVSDLTLQRVDRTGAAVDGGLTLRSNARLGFSWSGDPKPEPTPSVYVPALARTGSAAGGGLALAGVLIVFWLIVRNRNVR